MSETKRSTLFPPISDVLSRLLVLLLIVIPVHLISTNIQDVGCITLFIFAVVIAWPIYEYTSEYRLFLRHAVLASGFQKESQTIKFLWGARLLKTWLAIRAFLLALFLIFISTLFSVEHWWVIYIDIIVLVVSISWIERKLEYEVNQQHNLLFSKRFAHWLNISIVAAIVTTLDFAVVGFPNTAHLEWNEVISNQLESFSSSECYLSQWVVGLIKSIEAVTIHAMQNMVPGIGDPIIQTGLWLLLLIPAAINVTLIQSAMLGGVALLEVKKRRGWKVLGDSLFSKTFMVTLIVLGVIYFYAFHKLSNVDFYQEVEQVIFECSEEEVIAQEMSEQTKKIATQSSELKTNTDHFIQSEISQLRLKAEDGIDQYLDWYYSVTGEYQRLALAFSGNVTEKMTKKIQAMVFVNTGLSAGIDRIDIASNKMVEKEMMQVAQDLKIDFNRMLDTPGCDFGSMDILATSSLSDTLRPSAALGAGVVGSRVAVKSIGKHAAVAMAAKATSKASVKASIKIVTKILAKPLGMGGGAAAGAAAGLICGPAAAACSLAGAIIAGVGSWLATDKILIEIDEKINREKLKEDLLKSVNEQLDDTERQLKILSAARIHNFKARLNSEKFIPFKDGYNKN